MDPIGVTSEQTTSAFVESLLLAPEVALAELVGEGLRRPDSAAWIEELLKKDPARAYLVVSRMTAGLPPEAGWDIWALAAQDLPAPEAVPFLRESLDAVERLLADDPSEEANARMLVEASARLAQAALEAGDRTGAREVLVRAGEVLAFGNWPEHAARVRGELLRMAIVHEEHDLMAKLARDLLEVVEPQLDEPWQQVFALVARVAYYELADFDLTLSCTEKLEGDADSQQIRGFALLRKGNWEEAREFWESQASAGGDDPAADLNCAAALAQLDRLDEAIELLDALVERFPGYAKGWLQRGLLTMKKDRRSPWTDLERGLELMVEERLELTQLEKSLHVMMAEAARQESGLELVRALSALDHDPRAEARKFGAMMRGLILHEAGHHAEAVPALRQVLALVEAEGADDDWARCALADSLIGERHFEEALELLTPLVEPSGLPEAALPLLDRLEGAVPASQLTFLRATANAALLRCPLAEAELTTLLQDRPSAAAYRLRGRVRLSTSVRDEEEDWNREATLQRFHDGITDLGLAAERGDENAVDDFRWVVSLARGEWRMRHGLRLAATNAGGQYRLIEGLAEADEVLVEAHRMIDERAWEKATVLVEQAQEAYEQVALPIEARRQDLMLADLFLRRGDPRRALEHLDRSVAQLNWLSEPPEDPTVAGAPQAEAAGETGDAKRPSLPIEHFSFLAASLGSDLSYRRLLRAQALAALGRLPQALEELGDERALIEERRRGGFVEAEAGEWVRAVMGILRDAGEPGRALALREMGLEVADGPFREAAVHVTCAGCWSRLDKPEEAERELDEARELEKASPHPNMAAIIELTWASIWIEKEPRKVAGRLSPELIEDLLLPPRQAHAHELKARALMRLDGEEEAADQAAEEAERLVDRHLESIDLPADRTLPQVVWNNARSLRCTLAARRGAAGVALLLSAGLKGRALAVQQALATNAPRSPSAVEETVISEHDDLLALLHYALREERAVSWVHLGRLEALREILVDEGNGGPAKLDLEKTAEALRDCQKRLQRLQAARIAMPTSIEEEPTDLGALRELLAGGERRVVLIDMLLSEGTCYLNGLDADSAPWTASVDLPEDEEMRIRASLGKGEWSNANPIWRTGGLTRIVDEIQRRTHPGDHIVLVRHGFLHQVSFHAIEGAEGPLTQRNTVSFAPSVGSVLACVRNEAGVAEAPAIIVADSGGDLPHARLEGQAIGRMLGVVPLMGFRADRRRVVAAIGEGPPSVLHIACHGSFETSDPEASRIMLAGGLRHEEGLVAGDLTARDVAQLPLKGSVVVLSACHSGVSAVRGGDEPFGLTRGFLTAGARAVVAARWAVNDVSTWLLMQRFAELWHSRRLPLVEAVTEAQRWVREMSISEMAAFCGEARELGLSSEVNALLDQRQAEGLRALGLEQQADATARRASLAAAGRVNRLSPSATDPHWRPFADRKHWAAFEVIGDWDARAPRATPVS